MRRYALQCARKTCTSTRVFERSVHTRYSFGGPGACACCGSTVWIITSWRDT